jgi:uncharacterized protein YyaL (SSP411 family)
MVAAVAKASRALGEPEVVRAAEDAARFVLERMRGPDGRLLHRVRDGEAAVPGTLDDHAFMAWGLLELYEATYDPRWLREAAALARAMLDRFWDAAAGGFFLTPEDGERLLLRPKEAYDGALPSGNSVAAYVLVWLGRMLADPSMEERAAGVMRAFSPRGRPHEARGRRGGRRRRGRAVPQGLPCQGRPRHGVRLHPPALPVPHGGCGQDARAARGALNPLGTSDLDKAMRQF